MEARDFVKSLRKDAKLRQRRAESLMKGVMEKRVYEIEVEAKLDIDKRSEMQLLKNHQIEERMEDIRRRKDERERKHLEWLRSMKQMKSQPPLFLKMGENFE